MITLKKAHTYNTHVQCLGIKDNSIRCSPSYVASFSSCQMTAILWGQVTLSGKIIPHLVKKVSWVKWGCVVLICWHLQLQTLRLFSCKSWQVGSCWFCLRVLSVVSQIQWRGGSGPPAARQCLFCYRITRCIPLRCLDKIPKVCQSPQLRQEPLTNPFLYISQDNVISTAPSGSHIASGEICPPQKY